ncbi:hypothetical protein ADU59_27950 [Pararhizobium polonicum]|uniref:Hydratase n=1 Tax=Pararhizobium polonicum TaxID=1612624 RepID=A0A1C7NT54_9HYPH|nr:hypothetical protein [Pararhizobium polonicum]OBZ92171.1 hypothetical protein ADU59_27950 [Pararhizobium polonicum]
MDDLRSTAAINEVARDLMKLRSEGRQMRTARFPMRPTDLRMAMETQRLVSEMEGVEGRAWKVAGTPAGHFVVAPLHPFMHSVSKPSLLWRPGMKLEVEIAVKLGRDLPVLSEGTYNRSGISEAVSEVYLGVELVWSAIEDGAGVSFPLFLADRLGNMGYVLGPLLPASLLDSCAGTPLHVSVDGRVLYEAGARHPTGDVLTWLLGYANGRFGPPASLTAGSVITTGSLCGAFEIAEPGKIEVKLGSEASFDFVLSADL